MILDGVSLFLCHFERYWSKNSNHSIGWNSDTFIIHRIDMIISLCVSLKNTFKILFAWIRGNMEVLNCYGSDQMLDWIVLAAQTLNLHCFKSEILFGKLRESKILRLRLNMERHEKQLYWYLLSCVRWHWHWQRAFNVIVVLWSYQEPLSNFVETVFCVCVRGVRHSCRAFCQNYDFMKLLFWFCKCFIYICNCIWTFPPNSIKCVDWMNVRAIIFIKNFSTFSKWKMNEWNKCSANIRTIAFWMVKIYGKICASIINVWYDVIMVIVYH